MSPAVDADLLQQVRRTLAKILSEEIITLDANTGLADALGERYDSLTVMECITAIEGEFGIEVDFVADDVLYWFARIVRISLFVQHKLEDRALLRRNTE